MFEQTFIQEDQNDKKRYTVLVSLMLQVTTLFALIIVPLIYTPVLPQARLRSVFAAPTPPPPALPKAPLTNVRATVSAVRMPRRITLITLLPPVRTPEPDMASTTPDLPVGSPSGSDMYLPAGVPDGTQVKAPEPPLAAAIRPQVTKRVHMGVMEASLIYRVVPTYPAMAQQIHVQGKVVFTAVISKAGTIENLQLVSGHPILVKAAEEAIRQWRYKPTILNGEPVEVITNIEVNFTLSGR
jgi:protein TonB